MDGNKIRNVKIITSNVKRDNSMGDSSALKYEGTGSVFQQYSVLSTIDLVYRVCTMKTKKRVTTATYNVPARGNGMRLRKSAYYEL